MSAWKAKRFWKEARAEEVEGGWQVTLDGRSVRSPAKTLLVLPNKPLADAIAVEWDAQEGDIDPLSMPLTRAVNSTHDKVIPQREAVAEMLAAYGGTDLLCYRAQTPEALQYRQAASWDPMLDWVARHYGLRLTVGAGVMHVAQPENTIATLGADLHRADPFTLTAVHDLVTLSGSLVLALAVLHREIDSDRAWHLSRVDEDWQIEQWGDDEEASEAAAVKYAQFKDADRLLSLVRGDD